MRVVEMVEMVRVGKVGRAVDMTDMGRGEEVERAVDKLDTVRWEEAVRKVDGAKVGSAARMEELQQVVLKVAKWKVEIEAVMAEDKMVAVMVV